MSESPPCTREGPSPHLRAGPLARLLKSVWQGCLQKPAYDELITKLWNEAFLTAAAEAPKTDACSLPRCFTHVSVALGICV